MEIEVKCIYCGVVNPKLAKAHVVPRFMGTFKNQPTLTKRVCAECDRVIGECEAVLAKSSVEAVILNHIGITGRHKSKSSPFRRAHSDQPPIKMTAKIPGYPRDLRVEPIGDSKNVDMVPQLVLIDSAGNQEEIAIENPNCMSLREWKMLLEKCASGYVRDLDVVNLTAEEADFIKQIFRLIGIKFDTPEDIIIPPTKGTAKVRGEVVYDTRYFRAIAKIAYHYYLIHSKIFAGSEAEFDTIRRFIRYGEGNAEEFVLSGGEMKLRDPSGASRPAYYGHVLRTDIACDHISVYVQLCVGHDYPAPCYKVFLSREKHGFLLSSDEFGHYYRYFEQHEDSQYDGVIETIPVAQIIKIPKSS